MNDDFLNLLKCCGVPENLVVLKQSRYGRGLFSAKSFNAGDTILNLPSKVVFGTVCPEFEILQILNKIVKSQDDGNQTPYLKLLIKAAFELMREDSCWQPYFKLLPMPNDPCEPPNPTKCHVADLLYFNQQELEELQDDILKNLIKLEKLHIGKMHAKFLECALDCAPSLENFMWLHVLIKSRAIKLTDRNVVDAHDKADDIFLLPIVDFCNHDPVACNVAVTLKHASKNEWFVNLWALKDVSRGQELLLNYGEKNLDEFLKDYFFIPNYPLHWEFFTSDEIYQRIIIDKSTKDSLLCLQHVSCQLQCNDTNKKQTLITYTLSDRHNNNQLSQDLVSSVLIPNQSMNKQQVWIKVKSGDEAKYCHKIARLARSVLNEHATSIDDDMKSLLTMRNIFLPSDINMVDKSKTIHFLNANGNEQVSKKNWEIILNYRILRKQLLLNVIDSMLTQQELLN